MFDYTAIIRPNILNLEPYRCARDDYKEGVLLDANENTLGPALSAVTEEEEFLTLNRYPDPHQVELKQQIADFRNVNPNKYKQEDADVIKPENLCLGVGSDESIDLLMRCVCQPGKEQILICPPTYGMYSICAKVNDVGITKVPLKFPGFQIDVDSIVSSLNADGSIKLVYLTSPGNPTGELINIDSIVDLLNKTIDSWNGYIVIDEAYIDFADDISQSMSTLVTQYPNLVVLQTLSKSFGLAGIRLGVTFASKDLSRYLNAMKYPYNISSLTANVALRATGTTTGLETMKQFVTKILDQRDFVLKDLQGLDGVGKNLGGLESNFLLLQILNKQGEPCNVTAQAVYTKLAEENQVVVRFRGKELNCTGCLRISIGSNDENKILLEKFEKVLAEVRV